MSSTSLSRKLSMLSASALTALALALPALAEEAEAVHGADPGAGHEAGTPNIFAGDVGNLIWTLVVFLLVFAVLKRFAWKPFSAFLEEREAFIREALAKAKNEHELAARRHAEYSEKITGARAEATAIVEEGRRDAEVLRERIEREAKAEAEAMLERAKREIGIAKETAIKELYQTSSRLAVEVAGRIVGRELRPADHHRLIEESIAEIGKVETH